MGNVTNLATTGSYTSEKNGLVVTFNFAIDNSTSRILREEAGNVSKEETSVASFYRQNNGPIDEGDRLHMNIKRGFEVAVATAIVEAIDEFEAKVKSGAAL